MKHVFFLILTFALTACNGGGGGSSPEAKEAVPSPDIVTPASLFSVWKADNGSADLDFTLYQYDVTDQLTIGSCTMDVLFEDQTDTEEGIDFIVMKFSNAPVGCTGFNGTWMMTIEAEVMEFCAPPTWDTCYNYTKE